MKRHTQLLCHITALMLAMNSLAPAAGIPSIKTPAVKAPPAVPKVVSAPKVPIIKVPVAPKVPTAPKIPVVKTPSAPKIPVVKVPTAPKIPATPKIVKVPTTVKTPAVPPTVRSIPTVKKVATQPNLKQPLKPIVTSTKPLTPDLNPARRNPSPGSRPVVEGGTQKPNGKGTGRTTTSPPANSGDASLTTGGDSGTTTTSGTGTLTSSESSGSSTKPVASDE